MRVCDRCKAPEPKYHKVYVGGKCRDLCEPCNKELAELEEVFISMEQTFMKNKTLKHIDFQWIDNK